MQLSRYLPSAQFALIVVSLAVAGGLIEAARYVTKPQTSPTLATAQTSAGAQDWRATLLEIQANSGITLPQAPSGDSVAQLVAAAQSSNLTDSVGRTLLAKLTSAKAQGLGDDIPTQDQLVSQAMAQAGSVASTIYTVANLTTVPTTKDSLHAYGNAFMAASSAHPKAKAMAVMSAFGYALDYHDPTQLALLPMIQADYAALTKNFAALPVPDTLAPLHLQVVNDLSKMTSSIEDLQAVLSDPLRGLRGMQEFTGSSDEVTRVLTTIAGTFGKNGILFNKDEPGTSWSAFLSP